MAHQMIINLTDQEYAVLAAEAAKNGKQPEMLLHDMVQRLQPSPQEQRPMTGREFMELLYLEGDIENIPTGEPLTLEEEAERERLAQVFSGGKSAAEMIIEDRGPY